MKFGHINVNSLLNQLSKIKIFLMENLAVLAITETHLSV